MQDWQLDVQHVTKRFGDTVALDDLSFTVEPGELFGFVGSNGAGKSTTMRIALGMLAADEGQIWLGGRPVDLAVRRCIGYMPEQRALYTKMRVGDHLDYLVRLHGFDRTQARLAVGYWTERLDIAHRVKDRISTLSLGNQQRVQLAAALGQQPRRADPRRTLFRARPHRRGCVGRQPRRTTVPRGAGALLQSPARPRGAVV